MRTTFITELIRLAEDDESVILVVGDLGFNVVEPFAEKFPSRFFNAGVAEQAMAGIAAGLASEGHRVFTYSIANFPTFRAAEQIRNDIDYHNLPVTTVAVGGGLAYGNLGYSHHAVQDYGLMRLFPNMSIAAPGDPSEVKACIKFLASQTGPSYLRLGKSGEKTINRVEPVLKGFTLNFVAGNQQSDEAIISTGAALPYAQGYLQETGLGNCGLFTIPIWGMKYSGELRQAISRFHKVTVFEDHLATSGFGSWLIECLVDSEGKLPVKVVRRGLSKEVLGLVGSQNELNKIGGLGEL